MSQHGEDKKGANRLTQCRAIGSAAGFELGGLRTGSEAEYPHISGGGGATSLRLFLRTETTSSSSSAASLSTSSSSVVVREVPGGEVLAVCALPPAPGAGGGGGGGDAEHDCVLSRGLAEGAGPRPRPC